MNSILKTFLEGLYDADCVLSKLRGCPHILKQIWTDVRTFWEDSLYLPFQNESNFYDVHEREKPEDSCESWDFFPRQLLSETKDTPSRALSIISGIEILYFTIKIVLDYAQKQKYNKP